MPGLPEAVRFLTQQMSVRPERPAGRLCRGFLELLSAESEGAVAGDLRERMRREGASGGWEDEAAFLLEGAGTVRGEWSRALESGRGLDACLGELARALALRERAGGGAAEADLHEAFWKVFCPQAAGIRGHWEERVADLRARRAVRVLSACPAPLRRPAGEVLFTSNALLTLPPAGSEPERWALDPDLRGRLRKVSGQRQTHWYDHPVQMGTPPEANEILYGLRGLSEMLRFERARGNAGAGDRLQVALSASVTHPGLMDLARDYVEGELSREGTIEGLDVHVFTEKDAARLVDDVLLPAAERLGVEQDDASSLHWVFGVDGPYGRHYSFLKALAALWHVAVDPGIRATFKIDLDQVFAQERLVRETGASAFEHLASPLWGAEGEDADGRPVHLGMIAGALVNQHDAARGLFTPDVTLPKGALSADQWLFPSRIPQALSTEAEMMTRYGGPGMPDGRKVCLSRVHVTGGTVGIRVDSLRRHRPFTLSCIGRAEDQAYLLSVLFEERPSLLRYAHASGLIMRHDKEAFAGEAIRAAAAGKAVGDLERMLLFSGYAAALPWDDSEIRSALDPFTGCFVSSFPWTLALLCLAVKALAPDGGGEDGEALLRVGASRLGRLMELFRREPAWLQRTYRQERRAWGAFYDILARLEEEGARKNPAAEALLARARTIVRETCVHRR